MFISYFSIFIYSIFYNNNYCGCNCCKSCKNNNNNSYKKYDNQSIDTQIYDVLKTSSELKGKNLKLIGDRYLEILDNYSDEVKSLDEVTDVQISRDIILAYLNVNECLEKMHEKVDIKEKVAIIIDTILNDLNNKVFKFKDANLKCPRCLMIHEDNNCTLITYLNKLICNPYCLKFFYLFYTLFFEGFLLKNDYPLLFEFCNFFNNAITNPQFSDKIRCNKISDVFFDVYKDNPYIKKYHSKGFKPYFPFRFAIEETIEKEIENLCNIKIFNDYLNERKINNFENIDVGSTIQDYLLLETNTFNKYDFLKCKKGGDLYFILVFIEKYHAYSIRNINGVLINYDSFKVDKPTPISQKSVIRQYLNTLLQINNFQSNYIDYSKKIQNEFKKYICT